MKLFTLLQIVRNKLHTKRLSQRKGITIGRSSSVYYKSNLKCTSNSLNNGGGIFIGNNCKIGRTDDGYHGGMPFPTAMLSDGMGSRIAIGDNCRINGAYIHAKKSITIGSNCVIAAGVNVIDSNGHQVNSKNRTVGTDTPKEIVIGNNVWICMNATILKGSVIGDNSIIAAGSVIQGSIPPNTIASSHESIILKEIKVSEGSNVKPSTL